jgi:hypothetical protein
MSDDIRIEMEGGGLRTFFRQLLQVWAIGYVVLSLLPLFANGGNAVGGIVSLFVAGTLFGPWIVGVIVLGVLVLTSPEATPVIRRNEKGPEHGSIGPLRWDDKRRSWR